MAPQQRTEAADRRIVLWYRGLLLAAAVLVLALPTFLSDYHLYLARTVGINVIAAAALNILHGNAGLFSIGNAALLAVGAYGSAFAGVQLGLPMPVAALVGALFGGVVGTIIGLPSLRLRGVYLVMSTLAAHFVVIFLAVRYQEAIGYVAGVPMPLAEIGGLELSSDLELYYLVLVVMVVCVWLMRNLMRAGHGRAMHAIRDRELAAASVGVAIGRLKLMTWAFTSMFVGLAGAMQAYTTGLVAADTYTLTLAVAFVAMTIVGGLSSLLGSFVGAVVITLVPELVTWSTNTIIAPAFGGSAHDFAFEITRIVYGLVVIGFVLYWPKGLVEPLKRLDRLLQRHVLGVRLKGEPTNA